MLHQGSGKIDDQPNCWKSGPFCGEYGTGIGLIAGGGGALVAPPGRATETLLTNLFWSFFFSSRFCIQNCVLCTKYAATGPLISGLSQRAGNIYTVIMTFETPLLIRNFGHDTSSLPIVAPALSDGAGEHRSTPQ